MVVLRNDTNDKGIHHQVQRTMGHANILTHKKYDPARKNELLYPISPYDEIPTIRDLLKQLSLEPRRVPMVQRHQMEMRQTRQETIKNNYHRSGCQQRDATDFLFNAPSSSPRFTNNAHEVPTVIEMPITPSYSEDTELSLEECLRCNDEDFRDQPSIARHPVDAYDFNVRPVHLNVHQSRHKSAKVHRELDWPSDEDTVPPNTSVVTKRHKKNDKKFNRRHRFQLV